jgi:hypothetical protein
MIVTGASTARFYITASLLNPVNAYATGGGVSSFGSKAALISLADLAAVGVGFSGTQTATAIAMGSSRHTVVTAAGPKTIMNCDGSATAQAYARQIKALTIV